MVSVICRDFFAEGGSASGAALFLEADGFDGVASSFGVAGASSDGFF